MRLQHSMKIDGKVAFGAYAIRELAVRRSIASFWLILTIGVVTSLEAQPQHSPDGSARPSFAVVSIRLNTRGTNARGRRFGQLTPQPGGETYIGDNMTAKLLIVTAFHLTGSQLWGGPDWVDSDRYDIQAKAERPSSIDQLDQMLQQLLIDRFKLRQHVENRENAVYVLSQEVGGAKLEGHEGSAGQSEFTLGIGEMAARSITMPAFARALAARLGRPILNETALDGAYDFTLEWHPNDDELIRSSTGVDAPGSFPSMIAAMRKHLGLRLESKKRKVEFLVIDYIERPTPN
jgi:uncharacterized protein (TIGR03435 family)